MHKCNGPQDDHDKRRGICNAEKEKKEGESFTDVILRELADSNADKILSVVMGPDFPDKELAENVRQATEEHRKNFRMRQ